MFTYIQCASFVVARRKKIPFDKWSKGAWTWWTCKFHSRSFVKCLERSGKRPTKYKTHHLLNWTLWYWRIRRNTHTQIYKHWLIIITLRWINELKIHNYEQSKKKKTSESVQRSRRRRRKINNQNLIHFWIMMVKMKYFVWHEKARWTAVIPNNIYIFRALICMNLIFDVLWLRVSEWVSYISIIFFCYCLLWIKKIPLAFAILHQPHNAITFMYSNSSFLFASINTCQETRLQLMHGVDIIVVGFCFSLNKKKCSNSRLKQYMCYTRAAA